MAGYLNVIYLFEIPEATGVEVFVPHEVLVRHGDDFCLICLLPQATKL